MVPKSARRLLSVGLVLGFAVALPLFVWVVVSQKFNFNQTEKADVGTRIEVSVDDDPSVGTLGAPITIIEFADFQCEYCKQFQDQTFQNLMDAYPNQIRFVLRDFPLTELHPMAEKAAEAANCAGDQDKYWEMHDVLFAHQSEFSEENFKTWASQMQLNTTQFNTCLDGSLHATEIQHDLEDGLSYGVYGTPTFFINGIVLAGSQPLTSFQEIIDAELNPNEPIASPEPTASFDPSKITFAITTTFGSPNLSVNLSDLLVGKTYNVTASFILTGEATPIVKFLINNDTIGQVQTQFGSTNQISGSFMPSQTTNKYTLWISDNNKYTFDIGPNGPPNACNGTCGSNYNCGTGLFCSQGFCRNPSCPSDRTCGCATPTPTPTLRASAGTARPTPEIVEFPTGGINRTIVLKSPTPKPSTPSPTPESVVKSYTDYVVLGGASILIIALVILAVKLLKKSKEPPQFFPPSV